MDDFDIYSDLPDFAWLKQAYEEDVEIKKDELPISEKEVKELKEKLLKLEKVHKLVLSHYSSLWKTSKQERKRMDRQIADLRRQLDNLAFKRNHRTNVPSPVQLEPPIIYPTYLLPSNNSQYNYPPPLMGIPVPLNPQVNQNLYNYPPPPINPTVSTNQEWEKEEEEELLVDNYAVPSNVITPENSHSSDESEDDVVKKSEYRSTVYGERLRKKLLEEKRNTMKLKQGSTLDEKKKDHENQKQKQNGSENANELNRKNNNDVKSIKTESDTRAVVKEFSTQEPKFINARTIEQLNQNPKKLGTSNEENKLNGLKEKDVTSVQKETDIKTVKEGSNNKQYKEIETQNIRDQTLKKEKKVESEGNKEVVEPSIKRETDIDRKKKEEDLRKKIRDDVDEKRRDNDIISSRDRDFNKKIEDEVSKLKGETDLERRKRGNESRMRRERDLDKRRKEEDIEKTKREERSVKRRDEQEIERRRKDEEIEKTKREERLVKRRDEEEIERRRKDQEIERRRKEEIDIRRRRKEEIDILRRSEIERKRKDQEIERRRKEEDRRRKIEDERRKERELEILKEKENERRSKEEELHAMKLKDIEKKRQEKELEELIKVRKSIENEMNALNAEKFEEEENSRSIKNTICKEKNGKSQNCKGQPKEVSKDNSKQSSKKQEATGKNDKKVDQHSCGNKDSYSVDSNRPTMNEKRKEDFREYSSSKSDRYQSNYTVYENRKYNEKRSKRDQLDREDEPRKSLHRNKSRHRNESNSSHTQLKSEGRRSCSPKRMKLLERDDRHHDNLKNSVFDKNEKNTVKSPKRRRLSKSEERSPHKIKKRKISQDKDQDANSTQRTNVTSSAKLEEDTLLDSRKTSDDCTKNIIDTTSYKNISTCANGNRSQPTHQADNDNENEKIEKVYGDKVLTHLIDPQKTTQVLSKTENQVKDSNKNQSKLTKNRTDKQITIHANKKKTLIDDLFGTREESVDASADLKNVEKVNKTFNETVLSDLEEGEIEESDESMDSENLPKPTSHSLPTNKPIIMQPPNENENDKNVTSSLKNNKETTLKCPNELKNSILHNLLTQRKNDTSIQKTKIKSDKKISNHTESDNVETCKKTETCNKIVNRPADKSSQIIDEIKISVNKTKTIECSDSNEAVDSEVVINRVLPKVEKTKTIAMPSDNLITIMKKEKETTQEKTNDSVTVEKTDSEKSAECISNPTNVATDISSKQPDQNNSEVKHDKKRILHLTRTDICSGTNNIKRTCSKENVNVNNDCTKKTSGNSANTKCSNKEPLEPVTKLETPAKDDAIKNNVITPTKVPMRNIIVVKRRRRPVQLSDSPPVVVINNFTAKT